MKRSAVIHVQDDHAAADGGRRRDRAAHAGVCPGRHAGQGPRGRHHRDGRPRIVRAALVSARFQQVHRLPRRAVRGSAGPVAAAGEDQLPGRDLAEPHAAGAERLGGHRMRLHQQHGRAQAAGGVCADHLHHRGALCGQSLLGHRAGRAAARQDRGHDYRHDLGPAPAQAGEEGPELQPGLRQGPRRQLFAAGQRPRRCVCDGRQHAGRQHRQCRQPEGLQDRWRAAGCRADCDHAAPWRRQIQAGGRWRDPQGHGFGRVGAAVQQVVCAVDSTGWHGHWVAVSIRTKPAIRFVDSCPPDSNRPRRMFAGSMRIADSPLDSPAPNQ